MGNKLTSVSWQSLTADEQIYVRAQIVEKVVKLPRCHGGGYTIPSDWYIVLPNNRCIDFYNTVPHIIRSLNQKLGVSSDAKWTVVPPGLDYDGRLMRVWG